MTTKKEKFKINDTNKIIIFMDITDKRNLAEEKETLIRSFQEDNQYYGVHNEVIEIIEAKGYDDEDALNRLITLVTQHDYDLTLLTVMMENVIILEPKYTIYSMVLHTLNLIKPVEVKIFSIAIKESANKYYVDKWFLRGYLKLIQEKDLLHSAISSLNLFVRLAIRGYRKPFNNLLDR